MAVPKRRVSSARRDKRRSNVWKMEAPELQKCPNCGESLEFDFDDLECDCGCCSDADDEDYCGCGCGEQVEEPIK